MNKKFQFSKLIRTVFPARSETYPRFRVQMPPSQRHAGVASVGRRKSPFCHCTDIPAQGRMKHATKGYRRISEKRRKAMIG